MFGKNEIVGQKYFKDAPEDKLFVTSMFMTLQGEGPFAGKPAFFIRLAKCNLACSFCFVGSTKIMMGDGREKLIKDVEIGDSVVTWDEGKWTTKQVTNKFTSEVDTLMKLDFGQGKKIFTTAEHPFYVRDRGWVEAQDIKEGEVVLHYPSSERMRMFNPMFNEETAKKVSESQKGNPGYLNVAWKDPKFVEMHNKRMVENNPMKDPAVAIKGFLSRTDHKKTYVEERFEKIVEDLPIKFVGHGELVVNNLCPDFVVDGQNKLIEVWDDEVTECWGRDSDYCEKRRNKFKEEGYDVLFLPFTKKTPPEEIYRKTVEYLANGYKLKSKTVITKPSVARGSNGKAWTRLAGKKYNSATVYNIEVQDTHNYVANGLLVHNCDTFFDDGDWMTFDEIEERVEVVIDDFFKDKGIQRPAWTEHDVEGDTKKKMVLVMTGGEPTIQKNIGPFLKKMNTIFRNTQIESNGIVHQPTIPDETVIVISPKCTEKNGVATKYIKPNVKNLEVASCLKFVMSADQQSPYSSIPDWALDWTRETDKTIYISPMNVYNDEPKKSKEIRNSGKNRIEIEERSSVDEVISFWEEGLLDMNENQKNHEYAAKYCIENGCVLNLQMHLYASLA